jgi:putative oxidoreductase
MNRENALDIALLVLRVVVGVIMAAHGAQKVFGVFGGSGMEAFTGMIKGMGFTPPLVWAWIAAISVLGGGLLLILGIFARLSAAAVSATMLVAVLFVHWKNGFFAAGGG